MPSPPGKIRTSAYIPEELYNKLIQLAGTKKGRQSEIINAALTAFLEGLMPLERRLARSMSLPLPPTTLSPNSETHSDDNDDQGKG